jgi:hypothetical protein
MTANPSSPRCFRMQSHTLSKQPAIAMGLAHLAFRPERKERRIAAALGRAPLDSAERRARPGSCADTAGKPSPCG